MAWSYSNNPASSEKDRVRFLIGDTMKCDPLLEDEEIEYLLDLEGELFKACALACEAIAAKFSRLASEKVGDISVSLNQKADAYHKLSAKFRSRASSIVSPYAGGISQTDKEHTQLDSDNTPEVFRRHMQEHVSETIENEQPTYDNKTGGMQ